MKDFLSAWEQFEKTGKIEDYLTYKNIIGEGEAFDSQNLRNSSCTHSAEHSGQKAYNSHT